MPSPSLYLLGQQHPPALRKKCLWTILSVRPPRPVPSHSSQPRLARASLCPLVPTPGPLFPTCQPFRSRQSFSAQPRGHPSETPDPNPTSPPYLSTCHMVPCTQPLRFISHWSEAHIVSRSPWPLPPSRLPPQSRWGLLVRRDSVLFISAPTARCPVGTGRACLSPDPNPCC